MRRGLRLIPRPVGPHLHPQVEVHAPPEHAIHGQARRAADALQALPAGTDHDRLLPFAIDPDHRIHTQHTLLLAHARHLDRYAVGHFLVELQGEFLTDGLGDTELRAA